MVKPSEDFAPGCPQASEYGVPAIVPTIPCAIVVRRPECGRRLGPGKERQRSRSAPHSVASIKWISHLEIELTGRPGGGWVKWRGRNPEDLKVQRPPKPEGSAPCCHPRVGIRKRVQHTSGGGAICCTAARTTFSICCCRCARYCSANRPESSQLIGSWTGRFSDLVTSIHSSITPRRFPRASSGVCPSAMLPGLRVRWAPVIAISSRRSVGRHRKGQSAGAMHTSRRTCRGDHISQLLLPKSPCLWLRLQLL
jgi:hypothetical protein